jgi:hypothetical protein
MDEMMNGDFWISGMGWGIYLVLAVLIIVVGIVVVIRRRKK